MSNDFTVFFYIILDFITVISYNYHTFYISEVITMTELGNKEIMSRNIKYYMTRYNKSRSDMCKALGVKYTTFCDWVNAKTYPRIDKIELMANYFGISKSDLVENHEDEEQPTYYLDEDAREAADFLHKNPEYKVLFDASRNISKDDIEFVAKMLDKFRK